MFSGGRQIREKVFPVDLSFDSIYQEAARHESEVFRASGREGWRLQLGSQSAGKGADFDLQCLTFVLLAWMCACF